MLNSVREQKQVILHMIVESNKNEQIPRKRQKIGNESRVPQGQLPKLDPLDFDVLRSRCTALKHRFLILHYALIIINLQSTVQLWQRPVRASSPTTSDASANSVQIGAVLKAILKIRYHFLFNF
jgi:hypothetical protein